MRRRIRLTTLLVLASSGLAALVWADDNDWLIVPGKRVGPITPSSTRADLVKMFGASNVQDREVLRTDLGTESGTLVYGNHSDQALAIFWKTEDADSRIRRIRFCPDVDLPARCRWHTAEGITLGTTLKELEQLNARPFQLNGFDWGFGGLITSWNGGRLEKMSNSCGGITLRLDPAPGPDSDERARLLDVVEGDDDFSSTHGAMQGLNPVVDFVSMSLQNCK